MRKRISINNHEESKQYLRAINENSELTKIKLQNPEQDNHNFPFLKIIIVIDTYNNSSWASIATKRLVEELEKRGHSITVIAAIHDGSNNSKYYKVPKIPTIGYFCPSFLILLMGIIHPIDNTFEFHFFINVFPVLLHGMR